MRYLKQPSVVFIDSLKQRKFIYTERAARVFPSSQNFEKPFLMEIDDVANQVWGANMEIFSYKIREQNIEKLLNEDFNEKSISKIKIPPETTE